MLKKTTVAALVLALAVLIVPGTATAQGQGQGQGDELATLLLRVFGPGGLTLPNPTHEAHFVGDFFQNFNQFNVALVSQLTSLPLPSSGSGFTYEFDEGTGVFTRSTQSFGPIFAERAETIGRGKFSFSFGFQYFGFDELESFDVEDIPAVLTHVDIPPIQEDFEQDIITTRNEIDATISQFIAFFTYGVHERVDVSVAVPIVATDVAINSDATVQRILNADPDIHFFDPQPSAMETFSVSGDAAGIGDVILRVKGNVYNQDNSAFSLGVDLRLPTGDERDLLGTGTVGFKPFGIFSYRAGRVTPHVNIGYQYNGDSVLAGDVSTDTEADFPDQFLYTGGVDIGVNDRVTVAADLVGSYFIDTERLHESMFVAADGTTFRNIGFDVESLNVTNLALGAKVNPGGQLLIDFNVLIKLNDGGLRDTVTPLFGIEYGF